MGGDGYSAQNVTNQSNKNLDMLNRKASASGDMAKILADYSSGKLSLQDAIGSAKGNGQSKRDQISQQADSELQAALSQVAGNGPAQQMQRKMITDAFNQKKATALAGVNDSDFDGEAQGNLMDLITTNPMAAQRYMTDQLRTNDLTKGMFGQGGSMERAQAEEQDLQSRGFQLQPEDHEAYGQVSGDIARQFGQQEQNLAQALADRGLASSANGAAGAGFSGLQGNKMEQLAKAQMQIADKRMQNTQARLQASRQHMAQLGGLQQNAVNSMYNQNMQGRQENFNELSKGAAQQDQHTGMQQDQLNTAFQQNEATRGPSFGEVLGAGAGILTGGIAGGLGKGIGTAVGGGIGNKLGGMFTSKKTSADYDADMAAAHQRRP
jgi:hypothetical protein